MTSLRSTGWGEVSCELPTKTDTRVAPDHAFQGLLQQLSQEHSKALAQCHNEIQNLKYALEARDQELEVCRKVGITPTPCKDTSDFAARESSPGERISKPSEGEDSENIDVQSVDDVEEILPGRCASMDTVLSIDEDGLSPPPFEISKLTEKPGVVAGGFLAILGPLARGFAGWKSFVQAAKTPISFAVWPELAQKPHTSLDSFFALPAQKTVTSLSRVSRESLSSSKGHSDGRCKHLLIPPGSNFRIGWDLAGTLFLFYDIIMIPLSAFGPKRVLFIAIMEWIALIFWSGDMLMSCITGVVVKGETSMDPRTILRVYFKSWFILDVIVVFPDWIFTLMALFGDGDGGGAAGSGKLLRALRVLRTIRLLRLAKLQRILMLLRDRIESEMTFIIVTICKLVSMLLLLNHVLAAVWWSIGSLGKDGGGPNWIDAQDFGENQLLYKYLTSLHWSVCMFTPGSMDVQPRNEPERIMSIMVLVAGLVVFAAFISSLTASIAQLRALRGDKGKTMWMLRRFLRQHGIHKGLAWRVLRYVENAMDDTKDKKVSMNQVTAFSYLTDQLRTELAYEAAYICLERHPVFEQVKKHASVIMLRLVGAALSQRPFAKDDIVFNYGGIATYMYLIYSGEIGYVKTLDDSNEYASKDDWLCEQILWVIWHSVGSAVAVDSTSLICIKADGFIEVIKKDVNAKALLSAYAQHYADHISSLPKSQLSDIVKFQAGRQLSLDLLQESGLDVCSGRDSEGWKSGLGRTRIWGHKNATKEFWK